MKPGVCYVAAYDPGYSRNRDVVRALKSAGARVEVVQGADTAGNAGVSRTRLAWTAMTLVPGGLWRTADTLLRLLRCRVLVVGYLGQLEMLVFGPLAKLMGRPVIFNPLVTLTDTLVENRRMFSADSLPGRALRAIDRFALRQADLVLVDTIQNASYVRQLADLGADQVQVFPVGVDEDLFFPATAHHVELQNTVDVVWCGKYIPLHGVETIIRAAAYLQKSHPQINFELIGTGQDYKRMRRLASDLGVDTITWVDWLPYSELAGRLRRADIALGIFDGGAKAARVIPNKVHQALATALPVVTRKSAAIDEWLVDGESALLVPPDEPTALASALAKLAADRELRESIGRAGCAVRSANASYAQLASGAADALGRVGLTL